MSKKAKEAVRKILDRFGSKIPIGIDAIVKAHGLKIFENNEMESSVSGILMIKGENAGVMVNIYHPEVRKRFTIAHELGHYILHRSESDVFVDEAPIFYRGALSEGGVDAREIEANVFAAELMMPEESVRADFKAGRFRTPDDAIVELAARYDISRAAMRYRLRQLKLIEE
jgi:Zn-dependent peptidase ImmA (M78 family)